MTGCSSEPVTGFLNATFLVPAGTRNGCRGRPRGFSRFGTAIFVGVPTNIGLGSLISSGTSCPPDGFAGGATGVATCAGSGLSCDLGAADSPPGVAV